MHSVPCFFSRVGECMSKNNVLGGREGEIETEWMSSCGNISNIYSSPLSAVARAFEEQSNIRRWSEDSPFKPQGFIWERIPSVHRICSHFIWIHLFLRWKREERGSEGKKKIKQTTTTTGKKERKKKEKEAGYWREHVCASYCAWCNVGQCSAQHQIRHREQVLCVLTSKYLSK